MVISIRVLKNNFQELERIDENFKVLKPYRDFFTFMQELAKTSIITGRFHQTERSGLYFGYIDVGDGYW